MQKFYISLDSSKFCKRCSSRRVSLRPSIHFRMLMNRQTLPQNTNIVTIIKVHTFCVVPICILLWAYQTLKQAVSHVEPYAFSGVEHFRWARSLICKCYTHRLSSTLVELLKTKTYPRWNLCDKHKELIESLCRTVTSPWIVAQPNVLQILILNEIVHLEWRRKTIASQIDA